MKIHYCLSDTFFFFAFQINSFQAIGNYSSVVSSCLEYLSWKNKTHSLFFVVLLFRICYVSNGNMLLCIYWKIGKLWLAIYPKTLFLLQAKLSIEKYNFYLHFHVIIGDDIPRKTFFSLISICVRFPNLSSCVGHRIIHQTVLFHCIFRQSYLHR